MNYRRIIPCLDVKNGRLVKGINFAQLRDVGDPAENAAAYSAAGADELGRRRDAARALALALLAPLLAHLLPLLVTEDLRQAVFGDHRGVLERRHWPFNERHNGRHLCPRMPGGQRDESVPTW